MESITVLLNRWKKGDSLSREKLIEQVYPTLRAIASNRLREKQGVSTFETQDLVGEAYLKLTNQALSTCESRRHFFNLISVIIRNILVDRHRQKHSLKRNEGAVALSLAEAFDEIAVPGDHSDWLSLDHALNRLAEVNETAVEVVQLRYILGLSLTEVASAMEISVRTVTRQWQFARAWLRCELTVSGGD